MVGPKPPNKVVNPLLLRGLTIKPGKLKLLYSDSMAMGTVGDLQSIKLVRSC